MSSNHSRKGLAEKRNVILGRVEDALINKVSNILLRMGARSSQKTWKKLFDIAEDLDKDGAYAPVVNAVFLRYFPMRKQRLQLSDLRCS